MKVIFLDIDGVLNSSQTKPEGEHVYGIHAILVERFLKVVDITGAIIVLSSSWRNYEKDRQEIREAGIAFVDITPSMPKLGGAEACERGYEIQDWLDRHPEVQKYAIIDDDNDMLPSQQANYFKTSMFLGGLTESVCDDIIKHFN